MARQGLPARVGHDQLGAVILGGLLDVGGGDRVVHRGVGADDDDDLGVQRRLEGRGDGAGVQPFHQRGHRGGVAQPGAVVHVVRAEAGAHQLLEQVGLFVRAFGRAEPGQRLRAVRFLDGAQAARGAVQRLLPGGLAEVGPGVGRVHLVVRVLGHALQPDQRRGEPVRVLDVVGAEAAFDAQAVVVRRAVAAFGVDDLVPLDLVADLAAHAAVRAQAVHGAVGPHDPALRVVEVGRRHQRPRGAGLHALAAGHAGALPHGVVEIEHRAALGGAVGHADHVVDLHLAAGAHAQVALDAGVHVDAHRGVAGVGVPMRLVRARHGGEAALGDAGALGPAPEGRGGVVRPLPLRLVGDEQFHHQGAGLPRPFGLRVHAHRHGGDALAARGEGALALDLHHADPAVAVRAVARLRPVAQVRDGGAQAPGHVPDALAREGAHHLAVQLEQHVAFFGGGAVQALGALAHRRTAHSAASLGARVSGK